MDVCSFNKNNSSRRVYLYDTTLRDGSQRKGLSFSLEDKLRITRLLDAFGVDYIEGGWPGSNPKDLEYFKRMRTTQLQHARVVAFGSTRRVGIAAEDDFNLRALLEAGTTAVALVGKTWSLHVKQVLRTDLDENLRMIGESIRLLKKHGKEVIYDAEHFFDGFVDNPEYAIRALQTAQLAGADWLVLCDTNGRSLPEEVARVVREVSSQLTAVQLGVHAHNDGELAVANSIAAIQAGARQVQGTINGYGERCGNANLISLVPNLQLKLGFECVSAVNLRKLTELSRTVSEIANLNPDPCAAYVGSSAFAHKAGLHVAAVERLAHSYEHVAPETVGNSRQIVVSELSGRGNIRMLASELSVKLALNEQEVLGKIKDLEQKGYQFENAEGTVELLMRRSQADYRPPFRLLDMKVLVCGTEDSELSAEAFIKIWVDGVTFHTAASGTGPVHALDLALRKALLPAFPELEAVRLADYKVRILDADQATGATTRVLIEAVCGEQRWSTVGCSQSIITASYQALADSLELYLLRCEAEARQAEEVVA